MIFPVRHVLTWLYWLEVVTTIYLKTLAITTTFLRLGKSNHDTPCHVHSYGFISRWAVGTDRIGELLQHVDKGKYMLDQVSQLRPILLIAILEKSNVCPSLPPAVMHVLKTATMLRELGYHVETHVISRKHMKTELRKLTTLRPILPTHIGLIGKDELPCGGSSDTAYMTVRALEDASGQKKNVPRQKYPLPLDAAAVFGPPLTST